MLRMSNRAAVSSHFSCIFGGQMNYFVSHSTTYVFVKAIGAQPSQSATVIGVANVSAALMAIFHCGLASRESSIRHRCRFRTETIRRLMILSSVMGIAGNAVYATAIDRKSVALAILGRFVIGFSSAEILQREVMAACLPAHVVSESARLMLARVGGIGCGLLVGSATEAVPIALQRLGVRSLQASNWLMMLIWLVHLARVVIQLRPNPETKNSVNNGSDITDREVDVTRVPTRESDLESSSSEEIETPSSMMHHKSDTAPVAPIPTAFGVGEIASDEADSLSREPDDSQHVKGKTKSKQRRHLRQWKAFGRTKKLLAFHIGIPVSLSTLLYANFALETFLTATPLVTHRYFGWSGARAGTFLGVLAFTIIPVQYICAIVARRYEERTVLKVCTGYGLSPSTFIGRHCSLLLLLYCSPKESG